MKVMYNATKSPQQFAGYHLVSLMYVSDESEEKEESMTLRRTILMILNRRNPRTPTKRRI
jgi:hypothetical protein